MKNPTMKHIQNKNGAALITMLLFLVVLTVIGLTSVSLSSLENLTAMNERTYEQRMNDHEAGVEPQVNVLERIIADGAVPVSYQMPNGPIPVVVAANLLSELTTNLIEGDSVALAGAFGPDMQINLGGVKLVNMDIDYLFTRPKVGSAVEFASAYEGVGNSAASGGTEKIFQMISQSTHKSTSGEITNSYTCVVSGACQK